MTASLGTVSVSEIDDKLKSHGCPANSSEKEKLQYFYRLYQEKESNLNGALENIEILRQQFEADRSQYEGYVDHITQLTQGREELILEYEAENKELKQDIQALNEQLNSYRNIETKDLLISQGLDDIAHRMPGEQIAYLLVERARLMDDMEALQQQCYVQTAEGRYTAEDLYKMMQNDHPRQDLRPRPFNNKENRNVANEMESSWSNLKDLLSKVDDLEVNNHLLEQRLKLVSPKDYEELVSGRAKPVAEQQQMLNQKRHEAALQKPFIPPKDLNEATTRLKEAEIRAAELESMEEELKGKNAELERTKRRLQLAEATRSGVSDSEVDSVKSSGGGGRESELSKYGENIERMLTSFESQLKQMKTSAEEKQSSEDKAALSTQLQNVQREFESIKTELVKMIEKYNHQYQKYTAHKLTSKNRIFKAKESFKREKLQLTEKIEQLENEMALIKVTLTKEMEYKDNMERSHHNLLKEQRDLMSRLSEQEDIVQQQTLHVTALTVKAQCLEDENMTLNQRIESLSKHKMALDRSAKERRVMQESTANTINTVHGDDPRLLDSITGSKTNTTTKLTLS